MIILRLIAILCSLIVIFLSGWNLSRIHYLEKKFDAMDAFNKGYLEGLQDGSMFFPKEDESQTEDEILREQCRAFMGIVEQTERSTE